MLDGTRKTTRPSGDGGDTGEDAPASCPFCGCTDRIKDVIAANPRIHAVHQCPECGRWFDDLGSACPRCGSRGELLGYVDAPGCGMYTQYRCFRCGHGFMVRMNRDGDACQT
ncbi:hypothetical protein [Methanoculleus sp.]|uniref:hypothetical protein n=1 Tax=Methanoculleus sp. TaxID=90427 RepID=UPI002610CB2A|nr:hypothetical protein [Methanoculleus sp.]